MQKKNSILIIMVITALIASIGVYFSFINTNNFLQSLPKVEDIIRQLQEVENKVLAPAPLVQQTQQSGSILTTSGVLDWTNKHRANSGLAPLSVNTTLNFAAKKKLKDMFDNQYFEHVSPTGIGPAELIKSVGYDYKVVGENLALGNFESDKALVQAWMDSPGHRANILNQDFTEIGIAVGEVVYNGQTVWMAIQEFGRQLPSCQSPNEQTKIKIKNYQTEISSLYAQLQSLSAELKRKPRSQSEADEYNKKVDQYNKILLEYKTKVAEMNKLVTQYNAEVDNYNICIKG